MINNIVKRAALSGLLMSSVLQWWAAGQAAPAVGGGPPEIVPVSPINRDKTGTKLPAANEISSQTPCFPGLASCGDLRAEGTGLLKRIFASHRTVSTSDDKALGRESLRNSARTHPHSPEITKTQAD